MESTAPVALGPGRAVVLATGPAPAEMRAIVAVRGGWVAGGGIPRPDGHGMVGWAWGLDPEGRPRWAQRCVGGGGGAVVRALDRAPGGDVWLGASVDGPLRCQTRRGIQKVEKALANENDVGGGDGATQARGQRVLWARLDQVTGIWRGAWSLDPEPRSGPDAGRGEVHLADLVTSSGGDLVLGGWSYGGVRAGEVRVDAPPRDEGRSGFVARVSPTGTVRWWRYVTARDVRGTVTGVSVDGDAVFVTGNENTAADGVRPHEPSRGEDAFIAALDAAGGAVRWRRTLSSPGRDSGTAIAASGETVVAVGYVGGTVVTSDGLNLHAYGRVDAYALGLDRAGVVVWQHAFGGGGSDVANAIAWRGDDVAIGGRFRGTVDFALGGLGPGGAWRATGHAGGSPFVVRYRGDGRERALFTPREPTAARFDGLTVDDRGNLAAVGTATGRDGRTELRFVTVPSSSP